ncbi:MAG: tetratricopeptide repeat protein [Bacteroidales bacterium]|nr:tetratricopeptide repeat protein [Bacteroidales bacterium]
MKTLEQNYKEDFNDILPVFFYKDKSLYSGISSNMDKAYEKAGKVIKEHSITSKPITKHQASTPRQKAFFAQREFNKWVDDSYLLMGKSFFYKNNSFEAQKNFMYVLNEYKGQEICNETNLWLARTKVEMGQYDDAKDILDKLMEEENDIPKKIKKQCYPIYADIYIQKKMYEDAIQYLTLSCDNTRKKKTRIRYKYIIAQLYQELGDNSNALKYYDEVIKMNPKYDIAFNAKINKATAFDGSTSSKEVINSLNKLLKDEKNKEYKDQIYFAMANVYYADGAEDDAIECYEKSIETSVSNPQQKAMSYLAIGEIYYSYRKYINAQPYFDSCLKVLPESYRNYSDIKTKTENLNILAKNVHGVEYEDSVQRIANMTSGERNRYIDKIIDKIRQEEEKQRQEEEIANMNSNLYNQEFGLNNQKVSGNWYFYNESVAKFGKAEFKKRWGDRPLEDNWRRSNKNSSIDLFADNSSNEEDEEENEENGEKKKLVTDKKSREYYLQNLPLTDSLKRISTNKIENYMFNTGMTYMNLIHDNPYAIKALEDFIARFPKSDYKPMVLYYLHKLYNETNNTAKANAAKQECISKYPESNYAKALSDPDFQKNLKARDKQLEKDYAECYKSYIRNDFTTINRKCKTLIAQNEDSYLVPKFKLLLAMADGKQNGTDILKKNLDAFVKEYPKTEEGIYAKKILTFLNNNESNASFESAIIAQSQALSNNDSEKPEEEVQEEKELYVFEENTPHYFVISGKQEFIDFNRLKFNFINYNLDYFTNFNFEIEIKEVDSKIAMLLIKTLPAKKQAMSYLELIEYNPEIYDGIDKIFTSKYVISEKNYQSLLQDKDISKYLKFFEEYYAQ